MFSFIRRESHPPAELLLLTLQLFSPPDHHSHHSVSRFHRRDSAGDIRHSETSFISFYLIMGGYNCFYMPNVRFYFN